MVNVDRWWTRIVFELHVTHGETHVYLFISVSTLLSAHGDVFSVTLTLGSSWCHDRPGVFQPAAGTCTDKSSQAVCMCVCVCVCVCCGCTLNGPQGCDQNSQNRLPHCQPELESNCWGWWCVPTHTYTYTHTHTHTHTCMRAHTHTLLLVVILTPASVFK